MYDQIWRDIKAAKHEPTPQELLDIVQALRGKFHRDDKIAILEALDDCCIYLSDSVAEETLTLDDFAQEPRRMELDADTPRQSGHVLPFLFNSL